MESGCPWWWRWRRLIVGKLRARTCGPQIRYGCVVVFVDALHINVTGVYETGSVFGLFMWRVALCCCSSVKIHRTVFHCPLLYLWMWMWCVWIASRSCLLALMITTALMSHWSMSMSWWTQNCGTHCEVFLSLGEPVSPIRESHLTI